MYVAIDIRKLIVASSLFPLDIEGLHVCVQQMSRSSFEMPAKCKKAT